MARFEPGAAANGKGRALDRQLLKNRATAKQVAKAVDAVQTDTEMALAGHRDARTHMRYVQLAQRGALRMPSAAVPRL